MTVSAVLSGCLCSASVRLELYANLVGEYKTPTDPRKAIASDLRLIYFKVSVHKFLMATSRLF